MSSSLTSQATRTRRRKYKSPPFVFFAYEILDSKAFKGLTYSAKSCLPYFLRKPKLHYTDQLYYRKEIEFSYSEARSYGFANRTFTRVIRELMATGFIDPVKRGGLKSGELSASKFRLSERWKNYGKLNFKKIDWFQIQLGLDESNVKNGHDGTRKMATETE